MLRVSTDVFMSGPIFAAAERLSADFAQGLAPELPEDLYCLIKKAVSMRKHLELNRKDRDGKFRLILVESRIHRLARYYRVRAPGSQTDPVQAGRCWSSLRRAVNMGCCWLSCHITRGVTRQRSLALLLAPGACISVQSKSKYKKIHSSSYGKDMSLSVHVEARGKHRCRVPECRPDPVW